MPKLRVHNLAISLDGYAAGPDQSLADPIGVGGGRLHEWVFQTRTGRRMLGQEAPKGVALQHEQDAGLGGDRIR